ncbi:MAG: terminase family protein [Patescibacteria group bacterium]|nr:terminase family protein [Patescibacteria group bacterium]
MNDESRRKLLIGSVQTGKSFSGSLEAVLEVLRKPELWIVLSASERQSIEVMEKVQMHAKGAATVVDDFFENTSIAQHTAKFANGGRIIALPANPDTARGYSGNVILDEFAIHRDAKAIWKAMVGRTMRGYKLRVMSSFKGKQNKFFELAKECGLHEGIEPKSQPVKASVWSAHWCSIEMAVREGLEVDVAELRETVGDEDIFMEEFMCVPIDGALDFIPLELVISCESDEAWIPQGELKIEDHVFPVGFDFAHRTEQYAGWDIARKRDMSVIWILRREDRMITRGLIYMPRMKFSYQREIGRLVAQCVDRMCIDATGIGAQLAEELADEFPAVVEPVTFTGPVKETLATTLKTTMEDIGVALPEDKRIRRAFQAVKRLTTSVGNTRFDAARTDAGHADEFWALALALQAGSDGANYVPASDGGMVGKPVLAALFGRQF